MIAYHGLDINPQTACAAVAKNRHIFVPWTARGRGQLDIVLELASSFAVDNSAYTAWRSGNPIPLDGWRGYYEWVRELTFIPSFDWAVIPDTIDGSEAENDFLLAEWPLGAAGVPVWHLHERLERLERLVSGWPRVALGSSGVFSEPGMPGWWRRMGEAMAICCDGAGRPKVKLHGLRQLDPSLRAIPYSSADSTTVGRNIGMDSRWEGTYSPPTKEWRAVVIAERLEALPCARSWVAPQQTEFDLFSMGVGT